MNNEYIIIIVGMCVLLLIVVLGMAARMYRKAGPNEALIVYGFRGPRVITGHWHGHFPHGGKLPRAFA